MPGRPHLSRLVGPVLTLAFLMSSCGGPDTDLGSPDLSVSDRQTCEALLAALPATLADKARRTDTGAGPGAIWGDSPLVLRCGVANPAGFDLASPSECTQVNGVGWYVPPEQASGGQTATFTTVGYRPRVSLTVLAQDQPEGGAAALAQLARVVKDHLSLVSPCT